MKAMILAAGVGSRLRPLTDTVPKPMLPIAGVPLLAHTLAWLRRYGVHAAALNLHHLPEVVTAGLGDGSAFGMQLTYAYEPELLGTAGAVGRLAPFFDQTFVVVYGDMLLDVDLEALLALHRRRQALMTIGLKHTATPHSQGMVQLGDDARVRQFVEKPASWTHGNLANAGLYLCEPGVLAFIPPGFSDFGHDIIPRLLAAGAPVYGLLLAGYLIDIGTPEAYAQAQRDWGTRR